ncbi:MAG: class II fructose-bisphosphate aldolase, partial [Comamonadaceae bacterium]|nr:class II fructose-bisphosphate aldolase [Comamonadaceae bacterium]
VLHLDHGESLEQLRAAIAIGYTSVMIDGSKLSFAENIALSAEAARIAHDARTLLPLRRVHDGHALIKLRDGCGLKARVVIRARDHFLKHRGPVASADRAILAHAHAGRGRVVSARHAIEHLLHRHAWTHEVAVRAEGLLRQPLVAA